MTRSLARKTLATAVGLAFASLAAAQSAVPSTQPAGQTGILIGRQAAPPAAPAQPLAKDAYKAGAAANPAAAMPRTTTGAQGIMQPPHRAMGGQDPSQGGTGGQGPSHGGTGGQRTVGAVQMNSGGGQDPSQGPTGGQKRTVGAVQMNSGGGQDPSQGPTGGQKRTVAGAQLQGQAGTGVQVRQGMGTGPAGQPPMTRDVPGQGLAGQPNAAASNAAKALR